MNKILLLLSVALLSSCSEQKQTKIQEAQSDLKSASKHEVDPFKFAKSHVWGDSIRGCNYQQLIFRDKYYLKLNSNKIIQIRKSKNLPIDILKNEELYDISNIEIKKNKFIFSINAWKTKIEFTLMGKMLVRTGIYEDGRWYDIKDDKISLNKYHPISFKICDKEAIAKGKFDGK